ncbi:NADPH-dependent FMN reductase [Telluribacter sp.]|uniref:NADPH-dependent FMN reductase n=1 Tax=Telluribacter sp. TaxID=1978767 RepID=UPI002E0E70C1
MTRPTVVAIPGSTRQKSVNHSLIKAITELTAQRLEITVYDGLGRLPQFNPDDDQENVAANVSDFRQLLREADGILICTPEYARGVPGTLKNAIDWTISSGEFPHKPTLLITASTDGTFGHRALMETLKAIEAKNIDNLQLVIQHAKTKISNENRITDESTRHAVEELLDRFVWTIQNS